MIAVVTAVISIHSTALAAQCPGKEGDYPMGCTGPRLQTFGEKSKPSQTSKDRDDRQADDCKSNDDFISQAREHNDLVRQVGNAKSCLAGYPVYRGYVKSLADRYNKSYGRVTRAKCSPTAMKRYRDEVADITADWRKLHADTLTTLMQASTEGFAKKGEKIGKRLGALDYASGDALVTKLITDGAAAGATGGDTIDTNLPRDVAGLMGAYHSTALLNAPCLDTK
ncbi:hypothetical protein [Oleisolibacter albus]|uniref:hypothetical protein n=1 Tax=Oleisolibacter albus TaxID=2171757 RepID=UPI0012D76CC0|nr:hypothetical protein [Oleisolibacter albus]